MLDLQTLKTPCLILDVERIRRNAARTSEIAKRNNVSLRPHVKTHKSIEVARIQTAEHNSPALTVSTLAEARAFARHGFADITYAVPIEPGKFAEAIEIVKSGVKLNLITDDAETPAELDKAAGRAEVKFDVFLKVDCGYHRCGVAPESKGAIEIPRLISDAKNLNFAGILTHAGHSYHARSIEEIRQIATQERDVMIEFAEKLRADSIEVPVVSIGSTPTVHHIDHLRGVNEIRPGNYIFFDAFQATLGSCGFEDCALTVLAAVVHRDRERRKIIVDAGAIALSKDRGAVDLDETCGYGRVLDLTGNDLNLRVKSVSQEHGTIHIRDEATFEHLKIGTRVRILANHSCLTAAQHAHYHALENGEIVDRWEIHRGW
ncbi:MAG TPA: alanine racemase [Pyrinomonadaceae bacterium]|jgi:D-serine deaminase-like pyridoxal phosphate-dependent protein